MIKSNTLKTPVYPEEFTEEDKAEYDLLYSQSKLIHPDIENENPFIIHMSVIAHIRSKNGKVVDFTDEELEEIRKSYKEYNTPDDKLIKTEIPEDHYVYDKENNPMYFPSKLEISCDEKNCKVILEDVN
jgi:hypothetical protein